MSYPTSVTAGSQLTAQDFNDFTMGLVYTYGEVITAGQWLYLKASDGKVYKGSAATQAQVDAFVGIAPVSGVANDTNRLIGPGKIISGLSGLTRGSPVYLGDTAGALSTTPGTFPFRVGVALSTTSMLIETFNERYGMNEFGDGSDGALALDGSNTYASILSKSGATYTALRDLFVTNIVMSGGAILDMAGYKLFGNGTLSGTGTIRNNGQDGGVGGDSNTSDSGTRGAGGTAGTPAPGITVPSPAASGAGGKSDYDTGADAGSAGSNVTLGYTNTSGSNGGAGGSGGSGGSGGTVSTVIGWRPKSIVGLTNWFHTNGSGITVMQVAPGSGGGGGGGLPGGAGTNSGGGGGGGGGAGGFLFICFANITGTIAFEAKGGKGGNGGAGTAGTVRKGGGGGAGGNGGIILLIYRYTNGSYTTSVVGGLKGTGGAASGGTPGSDGADGSAGTVVTLQLN